MGRMIWVITGAAQRRRMGWVDSMSWRRRVSLAVVALLVALTVLPLADAFGPEDQRCCRRGVCCHRAAPSDTECLRTACRCGGHGDTADGVPFTLMLGVLVSASPAADLAAVGAITPPAPSWHPSWQPDAPVPPPQRSPLA